MKCRICESGGLQLLHDFGKAPVAGYLTDTLSTALSEKKFSNTLVYCSKCHLVQQGDNSCQEALVSKVYSNYRPTYSMSVKVREYMEQFIETAMAVADVRTGIVLEIGSNDGSMFEVLRSKGIRPAGIDPSADVSAGNNNNTIVMKEFFSKKIAEDFVNRYGQVKLLFSRHTLEHVFDPIDFMQAIHTVLDDQGVAAVEVPYLPVQLNCNQYAAMTSQHVSFFSLAALIKLGELSGLAVSNAIVSKMDGGSIIVYFVKSLKEPVSASTSLIGLLELENSCGVSSFDGLNYMFQRVGNSIKLAREHIIRLKDKSFQIIGYGAGAKGQAMLNMLGLTYDIIPYVVDDTPSSMGMYIPGVGTKVIDSSDECFSQSNFVLITAPTHVDEIVSKEQIKHTHVSFIMTSPSFAYVSNL